MSKLENQEIKYRLTIIRHDQSEYNKRNFFTGWDNEGKTLKEHNYKFDECFTSSLKRL